MTVQDVVFPYGIIIYSLRLLHSSQMTSYRDVVITSSYGGVLDAVGKKKIITAFKHFLPET